MAGSSSPHADERYDAQAIPDPTSDETRRCRQCNGWGVVYVADEQDGHAERCAFCAGAGERPAE